MIVVSDTTPLRYLAALGELELLPRLFGEVTVPSVVLSECQHSSAPQKLCAWAEAPPPWLKSIEVGDSDPRVIDLDPGEVAAITAAVRLRADLLLIDERKGRARALALGLKRIGTLAILARAGRQGWLDFHGSVSRLMASTNFRASSEVIEASWQNALE